MANKDACDSAAQRRRAKIAAAGEPPALHEARRLCLKMRRALIVADEWCTAERSARKGAEDRLKEAEKEIAYLKAYIKENR